MITAPMITREIPREEWNRFFDSFSREHEGWIVTVEVVGSDLGDQEEATMLPLVGVTADVKAGESRIAFIVGGKPDVDVNRFIEKPSRIWFRHSVEEGYDAIDVESEDGTKTILQFRYVPSEETERQLPQNA